MVRELSCAQSLRLLRPFIAGRVLDVASISKSYLLYGEVRKASLVNLNSISVSREAYVESSKSQTPYQS